MLNFLLTASGGWRELKSDKVGMYHQVVGLEG